MEMNKDTRERIFAAADTLYTQAGRSAFPTVDAVRKAARVNMNDASAGMKEWRRAQTALTSPVAVKVPDAVQQASSAALVALWQEAQELANESLRAAQTGWDAERIEADTLNKQMADAYELQATELEAAAARITESERVIAEAAILAESNRQGLEESRNALLAMQQRAAIAEERAQEIDRRAADLRLELDRAHDDMNQVRVELTELRKTHASELDRAAIELKQVQGELAQIQQSSEALRGDLASIKASAQVQAEVHQEQRKAAAQEVARQVERFMKVQAERDQAQIDAGNSREEAAVLRGQVDAIKEQNAQLMQAFRSVKAEPSKPGRQSY